MGIARKKAAMEDENEEDIEDEGLSVEKIVGKKAAMEDQRTKHSSFQIVTSIINAIFAQLGAGADKAVHEKDKLTP